jgi:ribonuclease E
MPKQIIIAEQHRIAAVFAEDQIQELVVAQGTHQIGDIYLGVVENVLPGIDAAFVNIGDSDRNGFIHVTDLGPLRLRRNAGAITELLEPQQKVLVQVMKEPTGNKGPRLTGNITLPGRYLVLMPFRRGVNLSRRITSEAERSRLRALAILVKPAAMGLLVRTEAEGVGEEAIIEDLEFLQRQWETIQQETVNTRAPALMNRDDDFIQRVLRDVYTGDVNRIVVDSLAGLKRVKQHLMNWGSGRIPMGLLIDQHRERTPILEFFRVNAAIREAVKPRVDLPSGGYIVIEPTEALTVVDVNSGSFTRSATARETVLWTNFEAATEIARQLRLRNLAGVIVVDFIDMDARRDQLQVLQHFEQALKSDKARPQIAQLSELGLVELTRKRQGQNIYELFGRSCAVCGGTGHVIHLPGELDDLGDSLNLPNLGGVEPPRGRVSLPDMPSREVSSREIPSRDLNREIPSRDLNREIPSRESREMPSRESRSLGRDLGAEGGRDFGRDLGTEAGRELPSRSGGLTLEGEGTPGSWLPGRSPTGEDLTLESPDAGTYYGGSDRAYGDRGSRRRRRRNGDTFSEAPELSPPSPLSSLGTPAPGLSPLPAPPSGPSAYGLDSRGDSPRPARPGEVSSEPPSRFGGRRGRVIGKPPEVVTVPMTEQEEEVYSWAGISPLVLLEQNTGTPAPSPATNPNIILQVKRVGEGSEPELATVPDGAEPLGGSLDVPPPQALDGVEEEEESLPWEPPTPGPVSRPSKQPIPKITAAINPMAGAEMRYPLGGLTLENPTEPLDTPPLGNLAMELGLGLPAGNPQKLSQEPAQEPAQELPQELAQELPQDAGKEPPKDAPMPKPKPQLENRRRRRRSSSLAGDEE